MQCVPQSQNFSDLDKENCRVVLLYVGVLCSSVKVQYRNRLNPMKVWLGVGVPSHCKVNDSLVLYFIATSPTTVRLCEAWCVVVKMSRRGWEGGGGR